LAFAALLGADAESETMCTAQSQPKRIRVYTMKVDIARAAGFWVSHQKIAEELALSYSCAWEALKRCNAQKSPARLGKQS
jgi:hypothetical protein